MTIIKNKENVNPDHYKFGGIETIDYLQAKLNSGQFKGFLKGNIIKYISRADLKGGVEDYHKAMWYLKQLINYESDK